MGLLTLSDDNAVRAVILPYLATRGFVEGRNLVVDVRVGTEEQMPELAQALVGDKADVIIAASDWRFMRPAQRRPPSRLWPHQSVRTRSAPASPRAGHTQAETSRAFA
jgi:hypothetical protein